ncbi:MAG TPA: hypothetical protein VHB73_04700 [Alphaproteobacteria bacterium]|nr:hypothetical protein [Alphaproteobacteria bacterium]
MAQSRQRYSEADISTAYRAFGLSADGREKLLAAVREHVTGLIHMREFNRDPGLFVSYIDGCVLDMLSIRMDAYFAAAPEPPSLGKMVEAGIVPKRLAKRLKECIETDRYSSVGQRVTGSTPLWPMSRAALDNLITLPDFSARSVVFLSVIANMYGAMQGNKTPLADPKPDAAAAYRALGLTLDEREKLIARVKETMAGLGPEAQLPQSLGAPEDFIDACVTGFADGRQAGWRQRRTVPTVTEVAGEILSPEAADKIKAAAQEAESSRGPIRIHFLPTEVLRSFSEQDGISSHELWTLVTYAGVYDRTKAFRKQPLAGTSVSWSPVAQELVEAGVLQPGADDRLAGNKDLRDRLKTFLDQCIHG